MAREKNVVLKAPKYLHTNFHDFVFKDGFINFCNDVRALNEVRMIDIRILRRLCRRQLLELNARCDKNLSPTVEDRLLEAEAAMGLNKDKTDLVDDVALSESADMDDDEVNYTMHICSNLCLCIH